MTWKNKINTKKKYKDNNLPGGLWEEARSVDGKHEGLPGAKRNSFSVPLKKETSAQSRYLNWANVSFFSQQPVRTHVSAKDHVVFPARFQWFTIRQNDFLVSSNTSTEKHGYFCCFRKTLLTTK